MSLSLSLDNSVPGHKVNTLQIAIVGDSLGTVDIPIAFDEVSSFLDVNINVSIS